MSTTTIRRPLTGWHVFAWVAALFGVVIAVNLVFTYFAVRSWSGLSATHAYEDGLAYNRTLDEAAAQSRLGWRSEISWRDASLEARLIDRTGAPLDGMIVTARLVRPVQQGFDQQVTLRPVGNGRYVADAPLPLPGQWEVALDARQGASRYQARARVMVP